MSNRCPAILVLVLAVGLGVGPAAAGVFVSFLESYEHATNLDYVKALVATSDGGRTWEIIKPLISSD